MSIIRDLFKPMLEGEYNRGFSAGVNAEKLVKAQADTQREYDILQRGKELGRLELLREMETAEVEEISADEFAELAGMIKEPKPFGFVGTIDDISLVLEEATE